MKTIVFAAAALTALALATQSAAAQTPEQAALAVVAPFYDGLNAAPGKDVEGVLRRATAPEWVSCGTNDVCGPRDQVIPAIAGRLKAIPDLKWEIKEVLVSGNRVTVRGEATGTPAGEFLGVPRQIVQADVDRCAHDRRREDRAIVSCRGLGGRGKAVVGEVKARFIATSAANCYGKRTF